MKTDKLKNNKVGEIVVFSFVLLCFISFMNEIFDLPHLLGAPRTYFNWKEVIIEIIFIAFIGGFTVTKVVQLMKQRDQVRTLLEKSRQDLIERNRELNELNCEKNKFLGIVAHDLRNPLATVKIASFQLMKNIREEEHGQKECNQIILKLTEFMLNLVNDLLDVSKIESGNFELNITKNDYVKFLNENLRCNTLIAQAKGIKIIKKYDDHIPEMWFDVDKIGQLVTNLVDNAIKYSYRNASITVEVKKVKNGVITSIVDQGQGIPENEQKNIFKEFHKANVIPTGGEKPTGLGLAIAKKIIDKHKGKIEVESKVGKGSRFNFILPLNLGV
ncbi:MAG: HAMP domain-containing histidine kinase [Candidatus Omnitrophica bacterium]|nr:HAMP domain-containing histidine kinase [Candidatus Omnitrophota bacterium]